MSSTACGGGHCRFWLSSRYLIQTSYLHSSLSFLITPLLHPHEKVQRPLNFLFWGYVSEKTAKHKTKTKPDSLHLLRGRDLGRRARRHGFAFRLRLLDRCPQPRTLPGLLLIPLILRTAAAAARAAATASSDIGRGSRGQKKGGRME